MVNKNVPAKRDNSRNAPGLFSFSRSDFGRQAKTIQRLRDGGMQHGHVKMSSKHEMIIRVKDVEFKLTTQNNGKYRW
jgi:hypothetical protein